MKKIFISQPMYGLSDEQIKKDQDKAFEEAKAKYDAGDEEVVLIDSILKDIPEDTSPLKMLGESLELMSEADAVYFANGWTTTRGCIIEYTCAKEYNIPIIGEDEDNDPVDDWAIPDDDYYKCHYYWDDDKYWDPYDTEQIRRNYSEDFENYEDEDDYSDDDISFE